MWHKLSSLNECFAVSDAKFRPLHGTVRHKEHGSTTVYSGGNDYYCAGDVSRMGWWGRRLVIRETKLNMEYSKLHIEYRHDLRCEWQVWRESA